MNFIDLGKKHILSYFMKMEITLCHQWISKLFCTQGETHITYTTMYTIVKLSNTRKCLESRNYKQNTSRNINSLMAMVQMQGMVARECILDSLLQHYAHVWQKWALFCYNRITHTTYSYKVDFHVVWWFVDEGATLKKDRGNNIISRLPSL